MKKILVILMACAVVVGLMADTATVGNPDPNAIGVDSAQQQLQLISVDAFEAEGFWSVFISPDEGVAHCRLFSGKPLGHAGDPSPQERYTGIDPNISDINVYGARVDFFRRGHNTIYILPQRPLPIEGITKTISLWVIGRNNNHVLKVMVRDFFNNYFELTMGTLNFQGWKKLSVAVPPQNPDGTSGIIQRNYHYNHHMGLRVVGFKIETDPMEAYGSYYIYFDDLRAVSDIFAEDSRDEDDMADGW